MPLGDARYLKSLFIRQTGTGQSTPLLAYRHKQAVSTIIMHCNVGICGFWRLAGELRGMWESWKA